MTTILSLNIDRGAIVEAPFKFTDSDESKMRPVLVISRSCELPGVNQFVAAMITSAKKSNWPLDVEIENWSTNGLTKPCRVRMKLSTVDERAVTRRLGKMDDVTMDAISQNLTTLLI